MLITIAALLFAATEPGASSAVAASPPTAAPIAAAAPKKKQSSPNDRVCWTEYPTSSHLPKTFCATRQEREDMEREARDSLKQNNRGNGAGFGPS